METVMVMVMVMVMVTVKEKTVMGFFLPPEQSFGLVTVMAVVMAVVVVVEVGVSCEVCWLQKHWRGLQAPDALRRLIAKGFGD